MKLRSVHHLIEVIVNKISGCDCSVKNIRITSGLMHFDVHCQHDQVSFIFFKKNAAKYSIIPTETTIVKKEFIIKCMLDKTSHPQLFQNYENIVGKYHNAQEKLSLHKRDMDAKIEHFRQVTWKKNQQAFADEMHDVELEKFNIYVQFGIETIKLD